jgi:Ricin-type beta-trefoil lectin domain
MYRATKHLVISGLAVIASILAIAAASIAANPVETYQNAVTKLCLDSNDFRQVYTHPCGGEHQKWEVIPKGRNVRNLKSIATRSCLDSDDNRRVYTHGCNGGAYQKWEVIQSGKAIVFRNAKTKFCLDSNAARQVYTHPCGGEYQKWR